MYVHVHVHIYKRRLALGGERRAAQLVHLQTKTHIRLGEKPPKVTLRGGTFFASWLIHTLFVVKHCLLTWG